MEAKLNKNSNRIPMTRKEIGPDPTLITVELNWICYGLKHFW